MRSGDDGASGPWVQSFILQQSVSPYLSKFTVTKSLLRVHHGVDDDDVVVAPKSGHNVATATTTTATSLDRSVLMPSKYVTDQRRDTYSSRNIYNKSRRRFLPTTITTSTCDSVNLVTIIFAIVTLTFPSNAPALQPRNEPMCSTGLFEHFMEYKCTPIGDIQDEGISKELTSVEEQTTNSLMLKLGIDDNVAKISKDQIKETESIRMDTPRNQNNQ
jgi:hypothetical protein